MSPCLHPVLICCSTTLVTPSSHDTAFGAVVTGFTESPEVGGDVGRFSNPAAGGSRSGHRSTISRAADGGHQPAG